VGADCATALRARGALWTTVGLLLVVAVGALSGRSSFAAAPTAPAKCALTPSGGSDPFYKPNAPVRSSVGSGFVLTGVVRSGIDCAPIRGARVELWLRGPDGRYDDAHRATVITDAEGRYRLQSNVPGGGGFQPHIHLRVAVTGFRTLETIYMLPPGSGGGALDLILEPEL